MSLRICIGLHEPSPDNAITIKIPCAGSYFQFAIILFHVLETAKPITLYPEE